MGGAQNPYVINWFKKKTDWSLGQHASACYSVVGELNSSFVSLWSCFVFWVIVQPSQMNGHVLYISGPDGGVISSVAVYDFREPSAALGGAVCPGCSLSHSLWGSGAFCTTHPRATATAHRLLELSWEWGRYQVMSCCHATHLVVIVL